ncbi:MAG: hypothetical protein V4699_00365 [Patescibacteria group bacterium]
MKSSIMTLLRRVMSPKASNSLLANTCLASTRKVKVSLFSRAQVRQVYFADDVGTKHALAEILAKRFPDELGHRLPPKRKPWMSQDSRMDIFDAVALD